jgi:hypothetical protein
MLVEPASVKVRALDEKVFFSDYLCAYHAARSKDGSTKVIVLFGRRRIMSKKGGVFMIEGAKREAGDLTDPRNPVPGEDAELFHSGKIYCANCIHCKLIPAKSEGGNHYVLRIRCAAGKWKKKLGQEKMYKYCTITRRYLDSCDAYEEMGNTREFIRDLKKTLPNKDEPYVMEKIVYV